MSPTVVIICLLLSTAAVSAAAEQEEAIRGEVSRLLEQLDSDQFDARRRAAARLEELVAKPELGRLLAVEFHQTLVRPEVSFEVRWHLQRWCRRLPRVVPKPDQRVSPHELDRLMALLDDDRYNVRVGAAQRLEWLLSDPKLVRPVIDRLKRRLADTRISPETWRRLEATWERARGAWLLTDPVEWDLPAVSDGQISQWIDELVRPVPADVTSGPWPLHRLAERELLDVLARDQYVPRVKKVLQTRLEDPLDKEAAGRLKKLLDWTRPAMVAEYWTGRRHLGEQHLLVGVPSKASRALRPSHFDRIDDRTAHCVSGNNLSPGEYPANVAFPHPSQPAIFHLVNLPTPRRRMAYSYYVKIDEATRLATLSRRTLDRMLSESRKLAEVELMMLAQLDPKEVSRFAGRYFALVEDEQLKPSGTRRTFGRPSRHGMICAQLATEGTKEAIPGLLEAIEKGVFLPPTSLAPYRIHWLAALSIAQRDPWPEVDAWLAEQIARTDDLVEGRHDGPELGATVAGVLLKRNRQDHARFGLRPVAEAMLLRLGIDGYRFTSDEEREKVRQWWERESARQRES